MSTTPLLVTICVPCYNQAPYIGATLDSILAQDYRPLEILVADDGSTDGSAAIISDYAKRYPDIIRPLLHPHNLGVNANMASFYPEIRGNYVFWFSGDDLFAAGKISKQMALMQANPDYLFCYHDVEVFREQEILYELVPHGMPAPNQAGLVRLLLEQGCVIGTLSLMINWRHARRVKHRDVASLSTDWLFVLDLAASGQAGYIPETLARYRRHNTNLSQKVSLDDEELIYDLFTREHPEYQEFCYRGRAALYLKYVFKQLRYGPPASALKPLGGMIRMLAKRPQILCFLASNLVHRLRRRLQQRN